MKVFYAWIAFAALAALTVVSYFMVLFICLSIETQDISCDFVFGLLTGLGCLAIASLIWALIVSVLAMVGRSGLSTELLDRARTLTEEGHTIGAAAAMLNIPRDDLYRALSRHR